MGTYYKSEIKKTSKYSERGVINEQRRTVD